MSSIAAILAKYNTPDHWLGTRDTASFEAEVVNELKAAEPSFMDFKAVVMFLRSNDLDDSATGLEYLYEALNTVLQHTATEKEWTWIKKNCFQHDDRFLETVLSVYTEDKYNIDILAMLDRFIKSEQNDSNNSLDFIWHSAAYYKAIYLRNTNSPNYESFLDESLKDAEPYSNSDIKRLKKELLVSRNEIISAFNLIKDTPELVLDAAEFLTGVEKEKYLIDKVINGKTYQSGMRTTWWEELCKISGDKYIPELLDSPRHCEMVNYQLYKRGRYQELMQRIDTGWIYDDLWGKINNDVVSKYQALKVYKKLKNVYPENCAKIMIDYSVFMIEKNGQRKSYHISAETMARAGKLSDKSREMAAEEANKLAAKYPKRTALLEELKTAGLLA